MLKVGDWVLLPPRTEIRSVRYGMIIRGPRVGLVTRTDPVQHKVQIQWDYISTSMWLHVQMVQGKCRKVGEREVEVTAGGQQAAREAAGQASSISEALEQLGFRLDEETGSFTRGKMKIPFTALAGHTVESFLKWLDDQELISGDEVTR